MRHRDAWIHCTGCGHVYPRGFDAGCNCQMELRILDPEDVPREAWARYDGGVHPLDREGEREWDLSDLREGL